MRCPSTQMFNVINVVQLATPLISAEWFRTTKPTNQITNNARINNPVNQIKTLAGIEIGTVVGTIIQIDRTETTETETIGIITIIAKIEPITEINEKRICHLWNLDQIGQISAATHNIHWHRKRCNIHRVHINHGQGPIRATAQRITVILQCQIWRNNNHPLVKEMFSNHRHKCRRLNRIKRLNRTAQQERYGPKVNLIRTFIVRNTIIFRKTSKGRPERATGSKKSFNKFPFLCKSLTEGVQPSIK